MKNWETLKKEIYFEDGSFRDIYVFDTNKEDWRRWANFVNENFTVQFFNGRTLKTEDRLNVDDLLLYFTNPADFTEVNKASILFGDLNINCLLFWEAEMESDINPKNVQSLDDHQAIVGYMQSVAKVLNKKVILTLEATKELVFIEV
ncbi:hypothetical protein FVR03_16550 [Pontibacter qinzhouensis]|uniref:Uncharacterized protein n=1 Tax=Pontibacter qinzhouensis TaxID=2603253 RepID=A0A5C8JHR8_9BACT|nr:hypothetical protein [Pontibacter qinzhouensis]TXK36901.1 hypothetical protein FVR03_16550 [Pontibacter qinzhouensis]